MATKLWQNGQICNFCSEPARDLILPGWQDDNKKRWLGFFKSPPKDLWTERQIEDKTTFWPSYQNKSCSECQQDVKTSVRQTGRYTERRADRQSDRETE